MGTRQPVTAISITESELYSVSQCGVECLFVRRILDLLMNFQADGPFANCSRQVCVHPRLARPMLAQGARMYHAGQAQRHSHLYGERTVIWKRHGGQAVEHRWGYIRQPADQSCPGHTGIIAPQSCQRDQRFAIRWYVDSRSGVCDPSAKHGWGDGGGRVGHSIHAIGGRRTSASCQWSPVAP